ncbi:MAG TPA: 50S ribosomal protein L21 [Candidatus Limnocylindria bacterium]|nr:50S ribosomal protein L21 [Candidatus Limnocylindria bacterium]
MYAVVTTGGKQYRVEAGSELLVEKLSVDPGASVTFDRVLLIGDGDEVTVGTPLVAGASVTGTVLRAERGPKIIIFKFKQKAKYRRRTGHRQDLVRVRIDEISADGKRSTAEAEPAKADTAKADKPKRAAAKPKAEAATSAADKPKRAAAKPKADAAAAAEKPKRATRAKAAATDEGAEAPAPKPKRASRAKAPKADAADKE